MIQESFRPEVSPSQLGRSEWVRLWWGFVWRGMAYMILCVVTAGAVGFLLGLAVGVAVALSGADIDTVRPFVNVAGAVLGLLISAYLFVFYIRWLLRARFGSLRLAVIREGPASTSTDA